jgi:uncharacterized protein YfaS (alpha-2-macroglobulin family)
VEASWGQPVRYDPLALARRALDFPLFCAEQSATRVLALAAAPGLFPVAEEREARLASAIAFLLDKQRWDGAFSLWGANGEADPWISAYAAEELLRARAAGATVPQAALDSALAGLARDAEDVAPDKPEEFADQAYRLHVLALAGRPLPGATRRLSEQLDRLPRRSPARSSVPPWRGSGSRGAPRRPSPPPWPKPAASPGSTTTAPPRAMPWR